MIAVSYNAMLLFISFGWVLVRALVCINTRRLSWKRELQLILVYICLIVVARFTFFPFSKVNGQIQPLVFDPDNVFPFRINLIPFIYLFDYPELKSALLNLIGNTAMFLPLGIVWPCVFQDLDTHKKVIASGVGCSLCIELLQLPFFDRVSDIDDLILNSLGFLMGYGIYLLVRAVRQRKSKL